MKKGLIFLCLVFIIILSGGVFANLNYSEGNSFYHSFNWNDSVSNENFTISAWINLKESGSEFPIISRDSYEFFVNSNDKLALRFRDGISFTSVSALKLNEWEFVSVVYNGAVVNFYLNTTKSSSSHSSGYSKSSDIFWGVIGKNHRGNFNGTIDELKIFNKALSEPQINFLYYSNLAKVNFNNWIFFKVQRGLEIGLEYFYSLFGVDFAGNTHTTGIRIVKRNSAPSFVSVSHSPSSDEFFDPNVTINVEVNVSDVDSNLDTAILQYKNSTGNWINATMVNQSVKGVYTTLNASFIPTYEDDWTYRIWANDTEGDFNISSETNLSVYWDCTWTSTSNLGQSVGWDENKFIGNIILNNTGDSEFSDNNCSLDFRLSYDLSEGRIYFDNVYYKPSSIYSLSSGSIQNISINATFSTEVKQEDLIITTNEVSSRSSTSLRNTTATLVSNQQGPYLYQSISSSPNSVYLTSGNTFNLSGYLRNLMGSATYNENNTAYNVSFNWTLPSGLTNSSGNISTSIENLTDNELHYNNIEASFSNLASMSYGLQTIYLYSSGYNLSGSLIRDADGNTLLSEMVNITFLCNNESDGVIVESCGTLDGDYVAPVVEVTTSSSGGGGGGSAKSTNLFDETKDKFELLIGKEQSFVLEIENTYDYDKTDITLEVRGINSEYISISPDKIDRIKSRFNEKINVRINAPAYFTENSYLLEFVIRGKLDLNKSTSFTEKKYVRLYFIEVPKEKADEYVIFSSMVLGEMEKRGFDLKEVSNYFNLINESYFKVDYTTVEKTYEKLEEVYIAATESVKLLEELRKDIANAEERGIDVFETKKLLYVAETIFNRGNYVYAYEKLKEAKLSYALEVKGEFNVLYEIKNHPIEFSGIIFSLFLLGFAFTTSTRLARLKKIYSSLTREEKIILGLMKVIQKDTFEGGKMPVEEYSAAMSQYEKKLNKVVSDKIKTQSKISNFLSFKGKNKALEEEKKELRKLIEETQRKYLSEGGLDTRVYQNILKTYSSRLAKVDEELVFLEAKTFLKSRKRRKRFFVEKPKKRESKKKIDKRIKKTRKEIKKKERRNGKKADLRVKKSRREIRREERRARRKIRRDLKNKKKVRKGEKRREKVKKLRDKKKGGKRR